MKTASLRSIIIAILLLQAGLNTFLAPRLYAQQDVYANNVTDSSTDFQNAYRVADVNMTNYAYTSNLLSLLATSYLQVRFPVSGKAGDVINVTVRGTGQILGANLLNNITLHLYDSLGHDVADGNGASLLQ